MIIADHHTAVSSASWDPIEQQGRLRRDITETELRTAHARYDDALPSTNPAAYSLLHHEIDGEGQVGAASITACRSLIATLNGTRPGPTLPPAERRSAYQHLATHLRDAGVHLPELRAEPFTATELEGEKEMERRFTPGRVEVRSSHGGPRSIGGYAAVFNKLSANLGGFVEEVSGPGVFSRSRTDGWPGVICRFNHEDNMILGTTNSGTLRMSVDEIGLHYEVDPPQARQDIVELVERGDIQRSSFAFRVLDEVWGLTDQGYPMRSLKSVQLIDVAPVVSPAYLDTSVGLRSLAHFVGAPEEEVRKAAQFDDLRRFLARSDRPVYTPPAKRAFGPAARMALLGRSRDPWGDKD